MTQHCIVLHYSEIGLKGSNRKIFEEQLVRNIRMALADLPKYPMLRAYGRYLINLPETFDWPLIRERLSKVVGLANFSLAEKVPQNADALIKTACRLMAAEKFETFRVETRRVQKSFPHTSMEFSKMVGSAIVEQSKAKVNLTQPDVTCNIEIFDNHAVVYTQKIGGLRGLPVGTGERAVSLLSSGIDSPVASWKIITRGVKLIFVHFHSMPYTSPASLENTKRLVEKLNEYQYVSRLYSVPFIEIQQAVMTHARPDYGVILYRRSMIRIAEKIAKWERARALVTGESIGQVASQTLANMRAIADAATLPILRPLSGSDKEEIIQLARKIDTFEISTEPYEDCCTLFVPQHPVTKAKPDIIQQAEAKIDLDALEAKVLRETEVIKCRFPAKND